MLTDNIMLPLGALFTCVYVGWIWGPKALLQEIETEGVTFRWKKAWVLCIRFITPAVSYTHLDVYKRQLQPY